MTCEDWNLEKQHHGHKTLKGCKSLWESLQSHTQNDSLITTAS